MVLIVVIASLLIHLTLPALWCCRFTSTSSVVSCVIVFVFVLALAVRAHLGSSVSSDISSIFGAVLALSVLRCCRFTTTSSLGLVFASAVALTINTISIRIGSNVSISLY